MAMAKSGTHRAAERMAHLTSVLAAQGSLGVAEVAPLLNVSKVTAAQDLHALENANWISIERHGVGGERRLCPCDCGVIRTVAVGRAHARVLAETIGSGARERTALSLCEAIPEEEARTALLLRLLGSWQQGERGDGRLGIILEDGISLPSCATLGLLPTQIETREELTRSALARTYGEKSVLYVRCGTQPTLGFMAGSVWLPLLQPDPTWRDGRMMSSAARMAEVAERVAGILRLLHPDVTVMEADGYRTDSALESLRQAFLQGGVSCPELCPIERESLAEKEMLHRLRVRLCEQILAEAREKRT